VSCLDAYFKSAFWNGPQRVGYAIRCFSAFGQTKAHAMCDEKSAKPFTYHCERRLPWFDQLSIRADATVTRASSKALQAFVCVRLIRRETVAEW
jgi:hypothetical protein